MGKLSSFYYGRVEREMDGVFTKRVPQMVSKAAYVGERDALDAFDTSEDCLSD